MNTVSLYGFEQLFENSRSCAQIGMVPIKLVHFQKVKIRVEITKHSCNQSGESKRNVTISCSKMNENYQTCIEKIPKTNLTWLKTCPNFRQ